MKAAFVVLALLLAGCATGLDPPPATSTRAGTPTPPGTVPTTPTPQGDVRTNGSWSLELAPAAAVARYGERVPFTAILRHPAPVPEASFNMNGQWVGGEVERVPVSQPETRISGVIYAGEGGNGATVVERVTDAFYGFGGVEITVTGVQRAVPVETRTNVSNDAPGLAVEMPGDGRVVVTYASARNASTTADERVSARDLVLVEHAGERTLVLFVVKAASDAVAPLPEPERSRVIATIDGLSPGPLAVRAITRVACFCFTQPEPVVEELLVSVR